MAPARQWTVRLIVAALALTVSAVGVNLAISAWVWAVLDMHPIAPKGPPPAPLTSLSATGCRDCHPQQHADWSRSRMGRSMTDPVFLADWEHDGRPVICKTCHAPLTEQHASIGVGLWSVRPLWVRERTNPLHQPGLEDEGVTCVVCHLQDGVVVGPTGAAAPHPTRRDPDFAGPERCVRCHQVAIPPLARLDRPLADTHREWEAWKAATGRTDTCVDCHMPDGRHTWAGAWDPAMLRAGLDVQVRRGGPGVVQVVLTNRAGHGFPSADPARALVVRVGDAEIVLARLVPLPTYRDLGDTTLAPAETRTLSVERPPQGEVVVEMQPLRFLPNTPSNEAVPIARLPLPGPDGP